MLTVRVHSPTPDDVLAAMGEIGGVHLTKEPSSHIPGSALIAFKAPDDEDISRYAWVHIGGAGPDSILQALRSKEAPILTRTIGAMGRQMAEYVLAYALHWLQGMDRREAFQARAEWQKEASLPRHLFDQDVAVLGTGAIGQEIARTLTPLCRSVTGYNSAGRKDDGFERTLPLSAFARADIVIGALPATAGTRGIIGEKILRAMSGGLLINIGRGSTLDEACLAALLQAGSLSHAVLDVFAEEPLPASHWAWSHPDVTVTPHVSGVTRPEDIAAAFNEKLPRFLNGTLRSEVDPAKGYGA